MNQPYQPSSRSSAAAIAARSVLAMIAAVAVSTAAHAEYRCSTPALLTLWEVRACDFARQDTPDALIHFVHRINKIGAGLYIYDYVAKADGDRWELARQKTRPAELSSAAVNSPAKGTQKAD